MCQIFDGEDQADHGDGCVEGGHEIPISLGIGEIVRRNEIGAYKGDDDDRNVNEEDCAPPGVGQEEAAQKGADGGADCRDRAPDSNRGVALAGFEEGLADEGECGGHQDCCSGSEECAGADENTNVGCECCNRRCDAENRESDFEHATVPDFVSERPGSEEQASEDKGVGVDDPQALLVARVEFGSKGGKRNVEDRVICSNDE